MPLATPRVSKYAPTRASEDASCPPPSTSRAQPHHREELGASLEQHAKRRQISAVGEHRETCSIPRPRGQNPGTEARDGRKSDQCQDTGQCTRVGRSRSTISPYEGRDGCAGRKPHRYGRHGSIAESRKRHRDGDSSTADEHHFCERAHFPRPEEFDPPEHYDRDQEKEEEAA